MEMTNLEILRLADDMTVEQLSKKSGIGLARIEELESGLAQPDAAEAKALSRVFCIPEDQLTGKLELLVNHDSSMRLGSWPVFSCGPDARGLVAVGTKACGILAIGAFSRGVISIGCFSTGIISLGLFSLGLLSAGCFSLGLLSVGLITCGILALGNIAIGVWAFGMIAAGLGCSAGIVPLGLHAVWLEGPAAQVRQQFQVVYEQTPAVFRGWLAVMMRFFS